MIGNDVISFQDMRKGIQSFPAIAGYFMRERLLLDWLVPDHRYELFTVEMRECSCKRSYLQGRFFIF